MHCKGIVGVLFGHDYHDVYDIDRRPVNAEELKIAYESITNHNFWNYAKMIDPNKVPTERVIKVYSHSICKRCGHIIKPDTLKI